MITKTNGKTLKIRGLDGQKNLKGKIKIQGAKNAVLKAMSASILFDGPVVLKNVPDTDDIHTLCDVITKLGAKVKKDFKNEELMIDASKIGSTDIDPELARSMRASVVLTGPLLARFGKVSFPAPGGCVIGARPIDLFLEAYAKMGAKNILEDSLYKINVGAEGLNGTEIFFNFQSVGGTETLMMAAVLAKGTTVLKNCAMEPEIVSVAEWLNSCGAKIHGAGTTTITIEGTNGKLLDPVTEYITLPDRIEAGSYLFLGALCASDLVIEKCEPKHMEAAINLLRGSGVPIRVDENNIYIEKNTKPNSEFKSFNIRTHEYPGFPTDLQSPAVAYLTQVSGESTILETIFEGRFAFTEDLSRMGAQITIMNPREILVKGPVPLVELPKDEILRAHDIRAGFAVVIAACVAKGEFEIKNVHLIDRGYEKIVDKLCAIGLDVSSTK